MNLFSFEYIRKYIMKFLKPSLYMGGLDYVLKIWNNAEGRDKGILLLVFAPMFLSLIGFVLSIVHFVLFILPSFLFRFLGWGILTAIFGSGGKYFYKHFTGHELKTPGKDGIIDVDYTDDAKDEEPEAPKKSTRKKADA